MMCYFTSETRVDFRRLVRDLAARFSMRIEMRQMGPRDDSRITGGLGICGKELCCASHLSKFLPVSIRMAKDQNLVLNPQSVSGQCNRLKCCLAYEQEFYQELRQGMPKLGKKIDTPHGIGRVLDVNLLTGQIRILLDDGPMEMFTREQILAMRQEQAAAEPSPEPEPEPEPEPS
jgi:cell fate regulator YaaT (PSP1 superfamily)